MLENSRASFGNIQMIGQGQPIENKLENNKKPNIESQQQQQHEFQFEKQQVSNVNLQQKREHSHPSQNIIREPLASNHRQNMPSRGEFQPARNRDPNNVNGVVEYEESESSVPYYRKKYAEASQEPK